MPTVRARDGAELHYEVDDYTEFALWFNVGGIDPAHCARAMRLAMERVIPHV